MSGRRFALEGAVVVALTLLGVCVVVGAPRLVGVGCDAYPWAGGVQLAMDESDFEGSCDAIEPLPWAG